MKKLIFLLATILFTVGQINASETITNNYIGTSYKKGESFNFIQGNIHFQVYQNGEFDFFIEPDNFIAADFHLGGVSITYNSGHDYDAYIQYDDYGAIIQIENTPIYYDYYGRISSIGDTYIRYNHRRLIQFGSMHVHYNHYGYFDHYTGYINYYNRHHYYHPYFSFYARPIFNSSIVSYNPYRRHYTPLRHRYKSENFRRRVNSRRNSVADRSVSRRSVPQRVQRATAKNVARKISKGNTRSISIANRNQTKERVLKKNNSRTTRTNTQGRKVQKTTRGTRVNTQNRKGSIRNGTVTRTGRSANKKITQNRSVSQNKKSVSPRKPVVRGTKARNKVQSSKRVSQNRSSQKRQITSDRRRG